MSIFILPNSSPEVPVTLTSDLSKDQLLAFPAFKTWITTLQHSLSLQRQGDHTFHACPYKLRKVDVQAVDFFRGGRLGFVKLKAEVSNDDGEKLPGSVFLRGGSVAMMVCLDRNLCLSFKGKDLSISPLVKDAAYNYLLSRCCKVIRLNSHEFSQRGFAEIFIV